MKRPSEEGLGVDWLSERKRQPVSVGAPAAAFW